MKIKSIRQKNRSYVLLCCALLLTFWLISLFEISSTVFSGKEVRNIFQLIVFKLLNHFYTVLFIFLFFLPFYHLFARKQHRYGTIFIRIAFVILVIIEFALTKYSLTTLLNLGADLLGYSLDDIYLTVTASESTSIFNFLPFIIFPVLFLVISFFLKKSPYYKHSGKVFAIITFAIIVLRIFYSDFLQENFQNKMYYFVSDVIHYKMEKSEIKAVQINDENEYPFLKKSAEINDALGPYFTIKEEKPNIVIIVVEGLGSEFVGDRYYSGFTPYLNSLLPKSLFWENFLSNTGRTFGALPSLTASTPFGEKGFLEIEDTPTHISIFSILKRNDYTTSFFSGDNSSFDKKINFLEYHDLDNIIDEKKYDDSYPKYTNGQTGFSWGYSDREIFRKTLSFLDDLKRPRLDLITTQTIHEPFDFPEKETYIKKIDSVINSGSILKVSKKEIAANKEIFASILYADNSIKMFIDNYKKRPEFENTIFVITGDHRLIPIAQKDQLSRFNVPFIIYSPLLKQTSRMKSVSSHLDFAPSLLAFLSNNYNVIVPEEVAWLGSGIDTAEEFRNIHKIPLMRYKGSLNDFVYKDFMYSGGTIYKIKEDFNTYKIEDEALEVQIKKELNEFKSLNAYVTQNDKIYPKNNDAIIRENYEFTAEELIKLEKLTINMKENEMFMLAREKAFNDEREIARLICNYILKKMPNYVDVRILKGRTLAWDANYDKAEIELLSALNRAPYYDDAYLALLDMYWWSSQNEKSNEIMLKAIKNKIKNDEIAFKMARAYKTMNNLEKAEVLIDSILDKQPKNDAFLKFKESLK
ncbi:Sulfatase [Polaribacter dokdonensis DSW-5]|uniref:Phosphoglycerol transferase MdoB n=1 Tax=Polaribacter dokdonensis DSW-5 TaxID=1300348 RepID=A0A0N0UP33_9FLAO|nr:Sulfatase [Polaribacter dokdonensis DSW-5]SEE57940.1 Phosphoglycerol transferase MdoB [Polaribacter dokdonensis DSW-5]